MTNLPTFSIVQFHEVIEGLYEKESYAVKMPGGYWTFVGDDNWFSDDEHLFRMFPDAEIVK